LTRGDDDPRTRRSPFCRRSAQQMSTPWFLDNTAEKTKYQAASARRSRPRGACRHACGNVRHGSSRSIQIRSSTPCVGKVATNPLHFQKCTEYPAWARRSWDGKPSKESSQRGTRGEERLWLERADPQEPAKNLVLYRAKSRLRWSSFTARGQRRRGRPPRMGRSSTASWSITGAVRIGSRPMGGHVDCQRESTEAFSKANEAVSG